MIQLDDDFLEQLGLVNPSDEMRAVMMHQAEETLNKRIGLALASELSDEQLDKIDQNADLTDEWLKENIPNYEDIAKREVEAYKQELKDEVARIDGVIAKNKAAQSDESKDNHK